MADLIGLIRLRDLGQLLSLSLCARPPRNQMDVKKKKKRINCKHSFKKIYYDPL